MKAYIEGFTGTGKTALSVFFSRLYREYNPLFPIYSNVKLNIEKVIYTQFGYLPFSKIKKGNCMILLDDYGNLDNTKNYSTYLSTIARKTNTQIILTIQYYTQITKAIREMCDYRILPSLTNLIYDSNKGMYQMTELSDLIYKSYKPTTDKLISSKKILKILEKVNGYYDTKELVDIPNERIIKEEIAKYSNDLRDVELNVCIYTKNNKKQRDIIQEICENKGYS